MRDSRTGKYRICIIPIVMLVIFISGVGDLWAADTSGARLENRDLALGKRMFREGNYREARIAFENVIALDSKNAQAHYFLGLLDYEEGDLEKAISRFQIAHDSLNPLSEKIPLGIEEKQAQLQFPDSYEARIYRKDGWYVRPKSPSNFDKSMVSLEAESSYGIEIKSKRGLPLLSKVAIGIAILGSFALVR